MIMTSHLPTFKHDSSLLDKNYKHRKKCKDAIQIYLKNKPSYDNENADNFQMLLKEAKKIDKIAFTTYYYNNINNNNNNNNNNKCFIQLILMLLMLNSC